MAAAGWDADLGFGAEAPRARARALGAKSRRATARGGVETKVGEDPQADGGGPAAAHERLRKLVGSVRQVAHGRGGERPLDDLLRQALQDAEMRQGAVVNASVETILEKALEFLARQARAAGHELRGPWQQAASICCQQLRGDKGELTLPVLRRNLSVCFAITSFELDRKASMLQQRLLSLVEMDDRDPGKSFTRFANKKTNVIGFEEFARMVRQTTRGRLGFLTSCELQCGLFRYLDVVGVGQVDLEGFKAFLNHAKLPRVFEHAIQANNRSVQEDPLVVVDVRHFRTPPSLPELETLNEQGFQRALGADMGLWIRRESKSNSNRRTRVTDLLCCWPGQRVDADDLVRRGFADVRPQPQVRRKSWLRGTDATPRGKAFPKMQVWIRRNANETSPVCNVLFNHDTASLEVPCSGFMASTADPGSKASLLLVRKLDCSRAENLRSLEREMVQLQDHFERQAHARLEHQRNGIEDRQILELRRALVQQFKTHTVDQLLNYTGVADESNQNEARESRSSEPFVDLNLIWDSHGATIRGWIGPVQLVRILRRDLGLRFPSEEMRKLFYTWLDRKFHNGRVDIAWARRELLPFNPASVHTTFKTLAGIRTGLLESALRSVSVKANSRDHVKTAHFLKGMRQIFRDLGVHADDVVGDDDDDADGAHQDLYELASLLELQSSNRLDLGTFDRIVQQYRSAREDVTRQINASSLRSMSDIVVETFGPEACDRSEPVGARFAKFFGRKRVEKVSLMRFKRELGRRSLASQADVEDFVHKTKLEETKFVDANVLVRVARELHNDLLSREKRDVLSEQQRLAEEESAQDAASTSSSSSEGDGENLSPARARGEPGKKPWASPQDWNAIRCAMSTNARAMQDLILNVGRHFISKSTLVKGLNEFGIELSSQQLDTLLRAVEIRGKQDFLHRDKLLRLLWPQDGLQEKASMRIDCILDHIRKRFREAGKNGITPQQLDELILYDSNQSGRAFSKAQMGAFLKRFAAADVTLSDRDVELCIARLEQRTQRKGILEALRQFLLVPTRRDDQVDERLASIASHLRARKNPTDILRALRSHDHKGIGQVSKREFHKVMTSCSGLPQADVEFLVQQFSSATTLGVQFSHPAFQRLFSLRPVFEVQQVMKVLQQVRAFLARRIGGRGLPSQQQKKHYWELFHAQDQLRTGKLSREAFRSVLCDDLELNIAISESDLQLVMRWSEAEDEPSKIDYKRFGKMVAPCSAAVDRVLGKVHTLVRSASAMSGGQLDFRKAFLPHDLGGVGHVTREDFCKVLAHLRLVGPQALSQEEVQLLLDVLDLAADDKVDYLRFCVAVVSGHAHDEVEQYVGAVASDVRAQLLRVRDDPLAVFARHDLELSGSVSLRAFLDTCHQLYIRRTGPDLVLLVHHFDWCDPAGQVDYRRFVEGLIRAGGPGGVFAIQSTTRPPLGAVFPKGDDVAWNSATVREWLRHEAVPASLKQAFLAILRDLKRQAPFLAAEARSAAVGRGLCVEGSSAERATSTHADFAMTGHWQCPQCLRQHRGVRFLSRCQICDAANPFL